MMNISIRCGMCDQSFTRDDVCWMAMFFLSIIRSMIDCFGIRLEKLGCFTCYDGGFPSCKKNV